ncbi:hypothetical protein HCB26_00610 [Listeria booriae]|uniref:Uncharacterized protein n=1 Tax=Listeria booriae TaxID=1552123 RepID=A0A7X0YWT0_9LIST|nr:hypothetical protein [Listeria booriae]MBC2165070.1 hypothetical protein [Listeria booriae]
MEEFNEESTIELEFDKNGNIIGGIIPDVSINYVERFLVNSFPESETRKKIFSNFKSFLSIDFIKANSNSISGILLDGSFCTNKTNPNDIDFLILLDASNAEAINSSVAFLEDPMLGSLNHIGKSFDCDVYCAIDGRTLSKGLIGTAFHQQADTMYKYWLGQFGFDRNSNHKGLIEVKFDGGELI